MHSFNDLAFVREKFRCQGKITGSGLGYIDMDLIGDMSRTPGQDIDPVREQDRQAVKEKLYTTAGLRSLEMEDPAFHPWIGGSQAERDRAYHQVT